nr:MAG TPA: hypothetical protein [Caudoviricetes sp.]
MPRSRSRNGTAPFFRPKRRRIIWLIKILKPGL